MIKTIILASLLVSGFIVGAASVTHHYTSKTDPLITAAEGRGFKIGQGVLEQEYICRRMPKFDSIEDAKAQIKIFQEANK